MEKIGLRNKLARCFCWHNWYILHYELWCWSEWGWTSTIFRCHYLLSFRVFETFISVSLLFPTLGYYSYWPLVRCDTSTGLNIRKLFMYTHKCLHKLKNRKFSAAHRERENVCPRAPIFRAMIHRAAYMMRPGASITSSIAASTVTVVTASTATAASLPPPPTTTTITPSRVFCSH